jgi:release factor glutamine methyltransferase
LCHALNIKPEILYSDFNYNLTTSEYRNLLSLLDRRLRHEPLPYLTGHTEFYGIDISINHNVLIPRPETELLVEKAIEIIRYNPRYLAGEMISVADIGTGSGAISISIATNLSNVKIYAVDISEKALDVAMYNIIKSGLNDRIITIRGDLLKSLPEPVDLIVANLPYIKESDIEYLMPEIKCYEPVIALNGGVDGLEKIREFLTEAKSCLNSGCYILLEIGQGQAELINIFLNKYFVDVKVNAFNDFNGIPRIISILLN